MWWWNEGVKLAISRGKDAHKVVCQNSTQENMSRCKSLKNKAKWLKNNEKEE